MRPTPPLGSLQRRSLEGIMEQDAAEVSRLQHCIATSCSMTKLL